MNKKGFTLIELIVVVIIVGILAAVAVPMIGNMTVLAKFSQVLVDVGQCKTVFKLYMLEHGQMPNIGMWVMDDYIAKTGLTDLPWGTSSNIVYTASDTPNSFELFITTLDSGLCLGSYNMERSGGVYNEFWEINSWHPWGNTVYNFLRGQGWNVTLKS